VAALQKKKLCFALIGSETLRGREIRSVLSAKKFPLKSLPTGSPGLSSRYPDTEELSR